VEERPALVAGAGQGPSGAQQTAPRSTNVAPARSFTGMPRHLIASLSQNRRRAPSPRTFRFLRSPSPSGLGGFSLDEAEQVGGAWAAQKARPGRRPSRQPCREDSRLWGPCGPRGRRPGTRSAACPILHPVPEFSSVLKPACEQAHLRVTTHPWRRPAKPPDHLSSTFLFFWGHWPYKVGNVAKFAPLVTVWALLSVGSGNTAKASRD